MTNNMEIYVKTLQEYVHTIEAQISIIERKIADIEYRLEVLEQHILSNKHRILMLLKKNGKMNIRDIYRELSDINKNSIRTVLYNLEKEGRIVRIARGIYQYVY